MVGGVCSKLRVPLLVSAWHLLLLLTERAASRHPSVSCDPALQCHRQRAPLNPGAHLVQLDEVVQLVGAQLLDARVGAHVLREVPAQICRVWREPCQRNTGSGAQASRLNANV